MVFMDDVEETAYSVQNCPLCPNRRTEEEIKESGISFSEWPCKYLMFPCEEEETEEFNSPYEVTL